MQIPILQAPALPVRSLAGIGHDIGELAIYGEAVPVSGLSAFPQLSDLWLSKASVEICRQIGETAWLRQLIVHDWRASDLTPIADLTELRSLAIAGSPKLKSLSGIERLKSLQSLILFDCSGYSSIEPLRCLTGLNTLCLEGGFSKSLKLETLEPISRLTNLQQLRLASLRTADKRLRSLHSLTRLREVFICKAFPKSEFQDLATALPLARGQFLDSHRSEQFQRSPRKSECRDLLRQKAAFSALSRLILLSPSIACHSATLMHMSSRPASPVQWRLTHR